MQPAIFEGFVELIDTRRRSTSVGTLFIEDVGLDLLRPLELLKKRKTRYEMLCPLHREKTPSFFLILPSNEYRCYGCGRRGGPLRLIEEFAPLPKEYLQEKVGYNPKNDATRLIEAIVREYENFDLNPRPKVFEAFEVKPPW